MLDHYKEDNVIVESNSKGTYWIFKIKTLHISTFDVLMLSTNDPHRRPGVIRRFPMINEISIENNIFTSKIYSQYGTPLHKVLFKEMYE